MDAARRLDDEVGMITFVNFLHYLCELRDLCVKEKYHAKIAEIAMKDRRRHVQHLPIELTDRAFYVESVDELRGCNRILDLLCPQFFSALRP